MTQEEIKEIMDACGNEVCREYCPWTDMSHAPGSLCEGRWCEDACEVFIEENQEYFKEED